MCNHAWLWLVCSFALPAVAMDWLSGMVSVFCVDGLADYFSWHFEGHKAQYIGSCKLQNRN